MKEQMDPCAREERIFATYPVPKALLTMALPTVISQIIYVIYNMADTWFAGLTGDANTVAAVSLCLPVYNLMTGLSNLFGIGGASAMARALGEHDRDKTRHCCAVAIWSALGGGIEVVWADPYHGELRSGAEAGAAAPVLGDVD